MSYILYINGRRIEVDSKDIAQTRQVNDLANLDTRQSSLTNRFTAPFTPNNVRAMEFVYMPGNQSNLPYQKNEASLYDADSGVCLIYKGWANVKSSRKGYEIHVYDGLIDFYRRIENKSLTDIGIAELNHAKSISNIVGSWDNTRPYLYAIADYNGKNAFTTPAGTDIEINTDYQIPSARVSYIWDRIFQHAGFTYSGSFFQTEAFKNLFLSFPKPVPSLAPNRVLLYQGVCFPRFTDITVFEGNVATLVRNYLLTLPRENFSNAYTSVTNNLEQVGLGPGGNGSLGYVYVQNNINILQNGTYIIDAFAPHIDFFFHRNNSAGAIVESGVVGLDPTGSFKTHTFNCLAGDKIRFTISAPPSVLQGLTFDWALNLVDGFDANFELAFVDFSATDFVKEVVQRGGLTAFKDKYRNHIEYLTMREVLQSDNVEDWSGMFQYKDSEQYRIGQYAKRNYFKYRYNTDNEKHNDGYFTIQDENLQDSYDVLTSKIYSPEAQTTRILGRDVHVFKIWDKELKDDGTINYKELDGRFYFLRFTVVPIATIIASEALNLQQAVTSIAFASFSRLSFFEILADNYSSITSIIDKAKAIDAYFYLKPVDIERFDFKRLIYVEQLGSYYLVNKILNFSKGKVTKCELLEVDYLNMSNIIGPPGNTASYITITSIEVVGCVVTVNYNTDATVGTQINVVCELNNFGLPSFTPPDPIYGFQGTTENTGVNNSFTFTLQAGAYYLIRLVIENVGTSNINSNQLAFENLEGCVVSSPSELTIVSATLIESTDSDQTYQINFTTDAVLPRNIYVQNYKVPVESGTFGITFGGWSGYFDNGPSNTTTITHVVSRIFGDATKLQIRIGIKESNIYDL